MRLIKYSMCLYFIFCFLISFGYAGTIDPDTPDANYIEYGLQFDYVVKISCSNGSEFYCGSAVVIAPEWIITAAHVVENCNSWNISIGKEKYIIDKMIIHSKYDSNIFGYHDIAMGHLSKPIKLDFYPEIYEDNNEVGKTCSIAGWGFSGTFNTGTKFNDGKRRAGLNIIDKTERTVLICSPSRKNEKITPLEYMICSGDSGGGLFIDKKLAGINSSVVGYNGLSNSTYGHESCHTRVSLYAEWISSNI